MSEGLGLYTKGFKDKASATKAMRKEAEREWASDEGWGEEYFQFKPDDITEESVVETRYYYHRACEIDSIGDNVCYECGETCGTNGRRTFAFNA